MQYLFIDGGCLRTFLDTVSSTYFSNTPIELDYRSLSSGFEKTFYYDCLPPKKPDETDDDYEARMQPEEEFFNRLRLLDGYHVYEGTTQRRRRRGPEQKQVDIMIAVDMLSHSHRRNMHRATLLTGDLDFKPLIEALVDHGMHVTLWYPPGTTSRELVYAADSRVALNVKAIHNWATPDFRARHPLPKATSRNSKVVTIELPIETWRNRQGREVELYQEAGQFRAIFPDELSPGNYVHVDCTDLALLKTFLDDVY